MKKVTQFVLMLCLILSGALCYASGLARTENENDTFITSANDLVNYDHQVKHSVEIGAPTGITALSTTNVTIRASDYILITGPFEVPIGAKLTMMVHPCPYPEESE